MSTLTIITLTTLVIGFLYRAAILFKLIKSALYYYSLNKEVTTSMLHFQSEAVGCIGLICLPCICCFFIIPIFLFFKVDWWIPIIAFITGLTIGNLIGYLIERLIQLPNHQTSYQGSFNLNASELTSDNGKLYRRAIGLLLFYCLLSLIISLIIIFRI